MDVHIHEGWIDFNKNDGLRKSAFHQALPVSFHHRLCNGTISYVSTVDITEKPVTSIPREFRRRRKESDGKAVSFFNPFQDHPACFPAHDRGKPKAGIIGGRQV